MEAMRDLSEMEHNFQTAVRRQRLAVETSDLMMDTERPDEITLAKQTGKSETKINDDKPKFQVELASKEKSGPQPEKKSATSDKTTTLVKEEDVDITPEEVASERGARRPPPVNSSILPLPWKGRLGYVSRPHG